MKRILTQHMDDHDTQWWVSDPDDLTNGVYLPVNQPVQPGMEADVRTLFRGNGRTKPITFARRFLSAAFRNEVLLEEDVR